MGARRMAATDRHLKFLISMQTFLVLNFQFRIDRTRSVFPVGKVVTLVPRMPQESGCGTIKIDRERERKANFHIFPRSFIAPN